MARPRSESSTKDIVSEILRKPSINDDAFMATVVDSQNEDFPSVSEVSMSERYVDPFQVPKWCDEVNYAFAWANLRDDIERQRVLETSFFRIVNRSSSCIVGKPFDRDFRDHGAVERQGMFLVFRPKDLDDKLRSRSISLHNDMVSSLSAGKEGSGYDITHTKSKEDKGGSGLDVYAYEEAGVHAEKAENLIKPGD